MHGLLLHHGSGPTCKNAAVQELLDMLKTVGHFPLFYCHRAAETHSEQRPCHSLQQAHRVQAPALRMAVQM